MDATPTSNVVLGTDAESRSYLLSYRQPATGVPANAIFRTAVEASYEAIRLHRQHGYTLRLEVYDTAGRRMSFDWLRSLADVENTCHLQQSV